MTVADVTALRHRFVDQWDADAVPTFYDLAPSRNQAQDTLFVRFSVRQGASDHYLGSHQSGTIKRLGRVWLQIIAPLEKGDVQALALIDQFAAIFRNWCSSDYAIQCQTEDVQGPTLDPDGNSMTYTVSIPYTSLRSY